MTETLVAAFVLLLIDIPGLVVAGTLCFDNEQGFCGVLHGTRSPALVYLVGLVPVALMLGAGARAVKTRNRRPMRIGFIAAIITALVLPTFIAGL